MDNLIFFFISQNPASISMSTSLTEALHLPGDHRSESRRSIPSSTGGRNDLYKSNLPSSTSCYTLKEQRDLQAKYIELFRDYHREREFRSAAKSLQHRDPSYDENLLKSIESIYFDAKSVSQCEDHIIYNLPKAILDIDFIITEKNRLKKQLSVVSRKVSELMLQHQPEYNEELQRVIDLQILLNDAINLTSKSRANLKTFKTNVTLNILTIIYNERRRQNATKLLESLIQRKKHLSSISPVNEVANEKDVKDDVLCLDQQLNGAAGSSNNSLENSPKSKGNSPVVVNTCEEFVRSPNNLSFTNDSRGNLPYTQSFDSLISSNIEKTAPPSSSLNALDGRSNSLSPVPQAGGNNNSSSHSPASR